MGMQWINPQGGVTALVLTRSPGCQVHQTFLKHPRRMNRGIVVVLGPPLPPPEAPGVEMDEVPGGPDGTESDLPPGEAPGVEHKNDEVDEVGGRDSGITFPHSAVGADINEFPGSRDETKF